MFGRLLNISPKNVIFLKIFSLEFSYCQPRDRIFVKGYGFLFFAKNMVKNIAKNISKNLSSNYSKKIFDHAKKSAADALKTT